MECGFRMSGECQMGLEIRRMGGNGVKGMVGRVSGDIRTALPVFDPVCNFVPVNGSGSRSTIEEGYPVLE